MQQHDAGHNIVNTHVVVDVDIRGDMHAAGNVHVLTNFIDKMLNNFCSLYGNLLHTTQSALLSPLDDHYCYSLLDAITVHELAAIVDAIAVTDRSPSPTCSTPHGRHAPMPAEATIPTLADRCGVSYGVKTLTATRHRSTPTRPAA